MKTSGHNELIPVEALTAAPKLQANYWKSIEQWEDPLALVPEAEKFDEEGVPLSDENRRRFLSLMAGSLALAGLAGCTRQPTETIMPYVEPPENVIPGKPKYYATAVVNDGLAQGVIVESHLGRPTKVEGNPDHPASLGTTSVHSQACLMDLYDPDRAAEITRLGVPSTWDSFVIGVEEALGPIRAANGAGLRLLTETVVSPTLGAQVEALLKVYPAAEWHQYDPAGSHSARAAAQMVFGKPFNTSYNFSDATTVVSLDADFLAGGPQCTRYAHHFADRRKRNDRLDMNRLYVVESTMTSTGGKADHRLGLPYAEIEILARALAAAVGIANVGAQASAPHNAWVEVLAKELQAHRGSSIIIPGDYQTPAIHALAHAMNAALGNNGNTVIYTAPVEAQPINQIESLRRLTADMNAGKVNLLLMLGGNPVYNAPADFAFAAGMEKVKAIIHLAPSFNETSFKATWHLPESHSLEDWGDARAFNGMVSILQPLIGPLYDSHSPLEVISVLLGQPGRRSYDTVREYWRGKSGGADFEQWWRQSVHDGYIADSELPAFTPTIDRNWTGSLQPISPPTDELEVSFHPDIYIRDGRYANNTWLQELPKPMTKLTWDNAIIVSIATAERLKLENQQHVELRLRDVAVSGSIWILPGQPDNSIRLDLGYGRTRSGRAGNGAGFNAYPLRTSDSLWRTSGLEMRKLSTKYPLATTQMHQSMEGRDIILSNTIEGYKQYPDFAKARNHAPKENLTLYPQWQYRGYKWGMSIDLTACVNCNACVVACQAENNIPVVGKQQVLARRAMHWLRIDTYYKGDPRIPEAAYQPVPCMQCEDAPCELVCPVQATNHSPEGLNNMIYNRCVGTRYCSNNCPYKVRRFNFLLYQDWNTETLKLQRNPDVSVRSRGVMEKCTYCVQRIKEAEITSEKENRPIRDGEIKTACQQVCPTEAIVFGDINNKGNRVTKLKSEKLDYSLLAELNTRPRTTYLAELKNPNPELPGGGLA